MNLDDKEHSESEFYYPTKDFTFSVPKKYEVLGPRNLNFREISNLNLLLFCSNLFGNLRDFLHFTWLKLDSGND